MGEGESAAGWPSVVAPSEGSSPRSRFPGGAWSVMLRPSRRGRPTSVGDAPPTAASRRRLAMRQRFDASTEHGPASHLPSLALRDAPAVADLFLGIFERDLLAFFPGARFEPIDAGAEPEYRAGPDFAFDGREVALYGLRYRLAGRDGRGVPAARGQDGPGDRRGPRPPLPPPVRADPLVALGTLSRRVGRPLRRGVRRARRVRAAGARPQPGGGGDPHPAHRRALDLREPAGLHRGLARRGRGRRRAPARPRPRGTPWSTPSS